MKLFMVHYMIDGDFESYLTVGESKEEVEMQAMEKLRSESCLYGCWVSEIDEVDGRKIVVK